MYFLNFGIIMVFNTSVNFCLEDDINKSYPAHTQSVIFKKNKQTLGRYVLVMKYILIFVYVYLMYCDA